MAILTKSLDSARESVAKAERTVAEWESKAATTRAEAAELDANSGALIFDDPAQAEKISSKITNLERTARVYDAATAEARQKLNRAQRKAFEVEASDHDKLARDAQKLLDSHTSKVGALLADLKTLDGCDYVPGRAKAGFSAELGHMQVPNSVGMRNQVVKHEGTAASIRYYIKTSRVPLDYDDLNTQLGTTFNVMRSFNGDSVVPPCVYAARDAGITFGRETADA